MKFIRIAVLSVLVFFITFSSFSQNWDQIIKICASDRQGEDNFGCAVAISGDYAIVGANYEDHDELGESTLFETGSAYIFKNESGTWTEVQKIVASDRASEDWFGSAVDIEGDYAVVGAYKEDHDELGLNVVGGAGSAYIFKNESGTWTQVQKIVASDRYDHDYFGYSVAISGDYIVIGAANEDENATGGETMDYSGSAYVFYNNSGTWQEVQKIVASDRSENDYFGFALDINGNHIIVGASYEDEDETGNNTVNAAGSAYIFENNAGNWIQTQKIVASDREELGWFGWSVAIDDNYAIVGAYHESKDSYGNNSMEESGAAYIYMKNAGTWSEVTKVVASDRALGDRFGWDVAINGDYAVVGAYCSDFDEYGTDSLVNSGAAYIYKNDAGNWSEEQKIVSNDRAPADYLAISVDVSDDYILLGAQNEDQDQFGHFTYSNAGSAYLFYNCREINVRQDLTDIPDGGNYDFGIIAYGESSSEIIFTIENTGVDDLLLIGDPKIEISGADASAFIINQSSVVSP
ncbi:MAG: FG-GAP repeat protein, partial [Bacteroidales bacterium]|nr:FG-GAP repeat protein [Bacteroidales bacterium]